MRAEAAADVVDAGGRLEQLSVDEPSLDAIYTRYFQTGSAGGAAMRREGSPWQGLGVVVLKELSDHLTSVRMRVLEWLVVLVALAAVYVAIQQIRDTTARRPVPVPAAVHHRARAAAVLRLRSSASWCR